MRHFVEMGIAMVVGMFALIPVSSALHLEAPEPYILVMVRDWQLAQSAEDFSQESTTKP